MANVIWTSLVDACVIWTCLVDEPFLDNYDLMELLNVDRRRMQWLQNSFTWTLWRTVVPEWRRLRRAREAVAAREMTNRAREHRTWQDDPYLSDSRCYAFYISFVEWRQFLRTEYAWLPVAMLRTSYVKTIVGGLSNVVRLLLKSWRDDFAGKLLRRGSSVQVIPISFSGLVADEAAIAATFSIKGASGRKPCPLCVKCISKGAGETLEAGSMFRDITTSDLDEFQPLSDQAAFEAVDHLQNQSVLLNKTKFNALQTNLGFTFNPHSVLADSETRNIITLSKCCFDTLHCFWSNGIVAVEMQLFVSSLQHNNFSLDLLRNAVATKVESMRESSPAARKRLFNDGYFTGISWKASGSEQLHVLPLLHVWILLLNPTDPLHSTL
eukprot:s421_g11.t1